MLVLLSLRKKKETNIYLLTYKNANAKNVNNPYNWESYLEILDPNNFISLIIVHISINFFVKLEGGTYELI